MKSIRIFAKLLKKQRCGKVLIVFAALVIVFSFLALIINVKFVRGTQKTLPAQTGTKESGTTAADTTAASQGTYTILFGGDVMLARGVGRAILYESFDPFVNVQAVLRDADLAVVNLECVVSDKGYPTYSKPYTFEANPTTLNTLKNAGIDVVSLANNHVGDYGGVAFEDMLERLKAAGLGYFGAGMNSTEAYQARLVSLNGITIALLAFSNIETPYFAASDSQSGLAWLEESRVTLAIQQARQQADVVIVMPHWGMEYTEQLHPEQERLARVMIDAGADLIVGSHPHYVQAVTEYNGKYIFYSLGNFVFDGPGPNAGWYQGILAQVNLVKDAQGVQITQVNSLPFQIDNAGLVTFL
jgi:poly-gamma-glutamate capsule biosynthesis protein CapA/YwtB (metallophosphatase superfamily)